MKNHGINDVPYWMRGFLKMIFYWRSRKLRKQENKRLIALDSAMETIAVELAKAKVAKNKDNEAIFNIVLYTLTIEYDVSVIKFMIPFEIDIWHKRFLARQMAVLMYESTNDLLKLLGRDFKPLIDKLPNRKEITIRLNEIRNELNTFKSSNSAYLSQIRNFSGAHRENDAFEQLVVIRNISSNQILEITAEFMKPITSLTSLNSDIMKSMSKENEKYL